MPSRVHFTFDIAQNVAAGVLYQQALKRDLSRLLGEGWPTTVKLDSSGALWSSVEPHGSGVVLELSSGALGFVHVAFGSAFAYVAAGDEEIARAGMDEIRSLIPRAERDREGRVPVTFWSYGPHGPMPMGRTLSVPSWAEISENYADETRGPLARLMTGELSWRGGQLILWHGETGTGKTTALRALAREWASWCEPHYITDPEKFFGDQSDYMLSVILQQEMFLDEGDVEGIVSEVGHGGMWAVPPQFSMIHSVQTGEPRAEPSWRLLILEDTGELLAADARAQRGQGLSRFLNVVDGLIGQGLRILVLVTTNEELESLHPAIARPGRCAVEQANAWLRDHGKDETVGAPLTLATLYAHVEGWDIVDERQATGFG